MQLYLQDILTLLHFKVVAELFLKYFSNFLLFLLYYAQQLHST
jgi:hypothetical protein